MAGPGAQASKKRTLCLSLMSWHAHRSQEVTDTRAWLVRCSGQLHISHMSVTCQAHVSHMLVTCWAHVGRMLGACQAHVGCMSDTCQAQC